MNSRPKGPSLPDPQIGDTVLLPHSSTNSSTSSIPSTTTRMSPLTLDTVFRIGIDTPHLLQPQTAKPLGEGKRWKVVKEMGGLVGEIAGYECMWATEKSGRWEKELVEVPIMVKVYPPSPESLNRVLEDFENSYSANEALMEGKGLEVLVEPLMAGMIEVWVDGEWELTNWAGILVPIYESFTSFSQRNLTSLPTLGLAYANAFRALEQLHAAGFIHGNICPETVVFKFLAPFKPLEAGECTGGRVMLVGSDRAVIRNKRRRADDPYFTDCGTPGFLSLSYLTRLAYQKFEDRKEDYLAAWGMPTEPLDMRCLQAEGMGSLGPHDDRFSLGTCLLACLVQHKTQQTGIEPPPFPIICSTDYEALTTFFHQEPLGSHSELDTITDHLAERMKRLRRVTDNEYENWLGPKYEGFFPILTSALRRICFGLFESRSLRPDPVKDAQILESFLKSMEGMRAGEEGVAMGVAG